MNRIDAIGTADVIEVLILLIKISLNVLFKVLLDKSDSLFSLCESLNLSNRITVSYNE